MIKEKTNKVDTPIEKCIHCGRCTKSCSFLDKYDIDLYDFLNREDLAYNCFLCGDCKRVCPLDIDGMKISLYNRKKEFKDNKKDIYKKYLGVILEKKDYKFKNYKNISNKSVFYPGCNFISYFPETTERLMSIMEDNGIGTIIDCCEKPIYEAGMVEEATNHIERFNTLLKEKEIEEVIFACPNCYYFLSGKLDVKCKTIYKKLDELKENLIIDGDKNYDDISIYIPCPDRDSNIFIKDIKSFISSVNKDSDLSKVIEVKSQCCGLGGLAATNEKEISVEMRNAIKPENNRDLYTYCATCVGNINKQDNVDIKHFLTDILMTNEKSTQGVKSVINRLKFRYK